MDDSKKADKLAYILEAAAVKLRNRELSSRLFRNNKLDIDALMAQLAVVLTIVARIEAELDYSGDDSPAPVKKVRGRKRKGDGDEEWPDLLL